MSWILRAREDGRVVLVPDEGKAFFRKNNANSVRLRICIRTKGVPLPEPGRYRVRRAGSGSGWVLERMRDAGEGVKGEG